MWRFEISTKKAASEMLREVYSCPPRAASMTCCAGFTALTTQRAASCAGITAHYPESHQYEKLCGDLSSLPRVPPVRCCAGFTAVHTESRQYEMLRGIYRTLHRATSCAGIQLATQRAASMRGFTGFTALYTESRLHQMLLGDYTSPHREPPV